MKILVFFVGFFLLLSDARKLDCFGWLSTFSCFLLLKCCFGIPIWTFSADLAQGESLQQERPEQLSTEQGCCRHAAASVLCVAAAVMQFRSRSPAAAAVAGEAARRARTRLPRTPMGEGKRTDPPLNKNLSNLTLSHHIELG